MSKTSVQESLRHLRNHHLRKCTLELVRKKISSLLLGFPFVTKFALFDSVARTAKTCCKHHAFTQLCCFCPCIFLYFCCCCFSSCRRLANKSNSNLLTGADEEVEVSRVVILPNFMRPPTKKNSPIFADKLTTDKNCDLCGINTRSK